MTISLMDNRAADDMAQRADAAAALLASLSNPQRLRILCLMVNQEQSVTALVVQTGLAQPTVSQHLKRLRDDGIVRTRRQAQTIYYTLDDEPTAKILGTLYGIYCAPI